MNKRLKFQAFVTCKYNGEKQTYKSNEVVITVCPTPSMVIIKPKNSLQNNCECKLNDKCFMLLLLKLFM